MSSPHGKRRVGRRIRFNTRKAMFVLPNLFTVSSIFCGFYAISLCVDDPGPLELYRAAVAIFFASFFDMFDGRVARLTRTQSDFGVQLDSLADLVSFGVAPAVLLYRWTLIDLHLWGVIIAFLYVGCGALRLARFNVLAARESGPSKYFLGLPIPLAAGTVVSLVMANFPFPDPPLVARSWIVGVTIVLAGLMVSNVRYRSFKDLKLSRKSVTIVFCILLAASVVALKLKPSIALASLFCGYLAVGLLEEVLFFRSRHVKREHHHQPEEDDEDDHESDDEFQDDDEETGSPLFGGQA